MRLRRFVFVFSVEACLLASIIFGQPERQQTNSFGSSGGNGTVAQGSRCCGGTLGAAVTDGSKIYALSNTHVLGVTAQTGAPVVQPSLVDNQCKASRRVASLSLALPIPNPNGANIDAAIAELAPGAMDPTGTILHIGAPASNVVPPQEKMEVAKVGRSTGLTTGRIRIASFNTKVDYSFDCTPGPANVQFLNAILVQSLPGTQFSATGDSGSLLVTNSSHNPVGLIFATNGSYALAHPIGQVLDALSQTFGHSLRLVASAPVEIPTGLAAPSQESLKAAIATRDELWSELRTDESVLGVGFSFPLRTANAQAELDVVLNAKAEKTPRVLTLLNQAPAGRSGPARPRYKGFQANIIETEPFRTSGESRPATCR